MRKTYGIAAIALSLIAPSFGQSSPLALASQSGETFPEIFEPACITLSLVSDLPERPLRPAPLRPLDPELLTLGAVGRPGAIVGYCRAPKLMPESDFPALRRALSMLGGPEVAPPASAAQ